MNLMDVLAKSGPRKRRRRVGLGESSGRGKTCGRGHKGAKSRSGWGGMLAYEGGQMPLIRRLPKRGFNNFFRKEYSVINIRDLNRFNEGEEVNPQILKEKGIVKNIRSGVKVLGEGELKKKLTVSAHKFSKTAEEKIKAASGKIKVL